VPFRIKIPFPFEKELGLSVANLRLKSQNTNILPLLDLKEGAGGWIN